MILAEERNIAKSIASTRKIGSLLSIYSSPEEDFHTLRDRWTPGTCEQLLKNHILTAWLQETTAAGVLWMHAGPGSGKSVTSSFLIHHLKSAGNLCQYYFFKYEDVTKRSANMLFRSLAYQISRDIPSYRMILTKLAEERTYNEKTESRQLWKALFESSLFHLNFERPLFWVIDAVDESDSINTIVSSLRKLPKTLPIRIILISRQNHTISAAFSRASEMLPATIIPIDDNRHDIRFYIQKEVVFLPGDSSFHAAVVEELVQRSEGNFLWVHLALQELLEIHSQDDLSQILDEIPHGMESMYRRMETSITQLSKQSDQLLSRTLLTWATYGKRPLHTDELVRVMKPKFPSLLNLRSSVNQLCGHFVTVDSSDRVSLVHSTAGDYLRHASSLPFSMKSRSAHEELFDTSLRVLLDPLLRSRISQQQLPPFCEYASTSWAYHLGRSSVDSDDVLSILVKFFKGPFVLVWIETLAILRQLGSLAYASAMLTTVIQRRRRSDAGRSPLLHRLSDLKVLEMWALDLLKVVGKFGSHLLQDSSAIYKFIPQLSPLKSTLHQQFADSSSSQITVSGLSIADWDDLLSRVSVGTSRKASLIRCSAHYLAISTSAKTITVWSTISFEEIVTMVHDEHIFQICFNGSGDRLVSYGSRTTRMWSLPDGLEVLCIPSLSNTKPLELTFMENDAAVLTCSDSREFMKFSLQYPEKGWQSTYPGVLKEDKAMANSFTNTPASLSFNSDVSQIAVGYRGAPLEVWDLDSGNVVNRCNRTSRFAPERKQSWTGVNRVMWHPIHYEVLGLYTDGVVFKWQPLTEAHTELPEATESLPSDIQIAPNGIVFLTSDVNGEVKIHSFHDFVTIYQLSSEDIITATCFSPDSQRFYDLRGSYCNVWEPNALIRMSESDDQGSDVESELRSMSNVSLMASEAWVDSSVPITCLAPNLQGSLICSGDDEGTITLWDSKTESRLILATSAVGMGIERITWSDDGKYLAYEDLGRRLVLHSLNAQRGTTSGFPWIVDRILNTKSNLEDDIKKELLIKPDSSMLLSAGTRSAQLWYLDSRTRNAGSKLPSTVAAWSRHPQNSAQVLAYGEDVITAFDWSEEGLQKFSEWKIDIPADGSRGNARLNKVITAPNGEYVLLLYSQLGRPRQSTELLKLRIFQVSSLDPSSKTIPVIELPQSIADLIEIPLTVLSANVFVFIDKAFWVCAWHFDPQALLRIPKAKPLSVAEGEIRPRIQDTEIQTQLDRLGVIRHFFLPRDWINANSLALCTVLADGILLCPRKAEVAVIRSGLGSEW